MKYPALLTATALLLVACDQPAPTEPLRVAKPTFQVGQDRSHVTLSRTAEWNSEFQITASGTFACPEGHTAVINVDVSQSKPNATQTQGSGFSQEQCKFGLNKWSVVVVAGGTWDIGPAFAQASVLVFSPSGGLVGSDTDSGDITIK